ncbi:hypothetical protein WR25_03600 [Diploscapter pachys]|uniref:SPK domain-containing protein n=1 Tax=Diploscapter pachys TaxID=2018661 RepID=A0A2A2J581_9BILA|nr:hypothetical protein WR25_03600 [Diploscapter pachys]
MTGRAKFTRADDVDMLRFLADQLKNDNPRAMKPKGNELWGEFMQITNNRKHTEMSMQTRIRNYILPKLETYDELDPEELELIYTKLSIPVTEAVKERIEQIHGVKVALNSNKTVHHFIYKDPSMLSSKLGDTFSIDDGDEMANDANPPEADIDENSIFSSVRAEPNNEESDSEHDFAIQPERTINSVSNRMNRQEDSPDYDWQEADRPCTSKTKDFASTSSMKEVKQEVGSNEEISIQRTNLRSPGKQSSQNATSSREMWEVKVEPMEVDDEVQIVKEKVRKERKMKDRNGKAARRSPNYLQQRELVEDLKRGYRPIDDSEADKINSIFEL